MIKTSTMVTGALPPKNVATLSPALSLLVLAGAVVLLLMFSYHATYVSSMAYSSPSIVIDAGRTSDGTESCTVRRLNTYPDSKILSWWDYGYQMSAMANRTILLTPFLESLDVDYVLVMFYSSDDINKFLWPVRIGSGVFPNDMPHERDFYTSSGNFDVGASGSPTLLNCVAYKL
eukprot:gene33883-39523_t